MSRTIYVVASEVDGRGFDFGCNYFEKAEDAIKFMRSWVAKLIRRKRRDGRNVTHLKVWRDHVMDDWNTESQDITFMVDDVPYDFRVWAFNLHSESINASKVANY